MLDFKTLESIIYNNEKFLLTTHVNPDADAIGSEIAFYKLLKKLGKFVTVINHSSTPYNLTFLDENKIIKQFDENVDTDIFDNHDVLVALDFNRSDRLVKMQNGFLESPKLKVCIDHHQDAENFVDHQFIDTSYSATGHIIYDFIIQSGIVILDYHLALPIFAAIMTDTGSFRFEKTSPKLLRIAADLLDFGIIPGEVYDKIYDQNLLSKLRLLSRALNTLTLYGNEKEICYMILRQDDFKSLNALESDTDTFVNYSLSIQNVKIGILFIELKDGFKVSFRSKGNIPINKLAAEFGGGGHQNAAGARFRSENMNSMLNKILEKASEYLK